MRPLNVFVAAVLAAFAGTSAIAGGRPSATIVGTVTLTDADGGTFRGAGARVALACGTEGATRTEIADEHGAFRFVNVPVDKCSVEADVQGFVAPPVTIVTVADEVVGADLRLGVAPLRVGMTALGAVTFEDPKTRPRSCQCASSVRAVGERAERHADFRAK